MKNILVQLKNQTAQIEYRNATVASNSLYLMITTSDIRAVLTHYFPHSEIRYYTESLPLNNMEVI